MVQDINKTTHKNYIFCILVSGFYMGYDKTKSLRQTASSLSLHE